MWVNKAFDDNYVVPMGPNVEQFEKELEAFVNENPSPRQARGKLGSGQAEDENLSKRVVALSCGTAAVHLALINCGVKAEDEVLVQSFTFCASSHPITYLGAKSVFVGSEKDSWNRRTSERNVKLA